MKQRYFDNLISSGALGIYLRDHLGTTGDSTEKFLFSRNRTELESFGPKICGFRITGQFSNKLNHNIQNDFFQLNRDPTLGACFQGVMCSIPSLCLILNLIFKF